MTNIQLSSRTEEWYTPPWLVDMIHTVIPWIDLDPASCTVANDRIGAERILTREDDALRVVWATKPVTIYLNPPGGKLGNQSKVALFWDKLMEFRAAGFLEEAIFMGFSLENMQVTQGRGVPSICDFPLVIPNKRIKFVSPLGEFSSPTHSNVIVYIPGITDNTVLFKETFCKLGGIMQPG